MAAEFELYRGRNNEYRWRLQAENNRIIADSGEGYHNESDAVAAIAWVKTFAPDAPVNKKT